MFILLVVILVVMCVLLGTYITIYIYITALQIIAIYYTFSSHLKKRYCILICSVCLFVGSFCVCRFLGVLEVSHTVHTRWMSTCSIVFSRV